MVNFGQLAQCHQVPRSPQFFARVCWEGRINATRALDSKGIGNSCTGFDVVVFILFFSCTPSALGGEYIYYGQGARSKVH